MSDDKRQTGSPDRDRISLSEDYEVQYWTQALGVSADELRAAVDAVGPVAEDVRNHLAQRR
ncbi:DUF3606 domain-containing protein [Lysobacteraceae bacterium NML93-0399]|nr:DUF3606 domain-containing protein [Xanthomonadaceae bacterium NML93-0399]